MVRGWRPVPKRQCPVGWIVLVGMSILALLLCLPGTPQTEAEPQLVPAMTVEEPLPPQIVQGLPQGSTQRLTISRQRLAQGRMLLVDEAHPIPAETDAPNTFSVLGYAHGRIACRDQSAQLGKDALLALEKLCVDARNRGIGCLTVMAGTRSAEQQRILLNERVAALSRDMTIEEAVVQAKAQVPPPGCSEHQLPWSVDIRICRAWNKLPEAEPLDASEEGQWLLDHAWMYGFVQRWAGMDPAQDDHRPYCFRYVGCAHARMMDELGMGLEAYLALLKENGALTLLDENGAPVLSAIYAEAGERHTVFEVPENGVVDDASLDNMGGAVLSVIYR